MKMFTKIAIVTTSVKDQAAAELFYTNVLGRRVVEEMPMMPGSNWLRLEFSGLETRIVLMNWFKQIPAGSLQAIVLNTDDIVSTRNELKGRGLEVSEVKD
jgi:catechol 2,3-dioxygenase-like lactoylglutathione lyase family enzyme